MLGALALALLAAVAVTWRAWPRDSGPVAPALTRAEVRAVAHRFQGSVTLLRGGSRGDAHQLWTRYRHQRWANPDGSDPRLLGISLAHVESDVVSGDYWIVYSDHVYAASLGLGGDGGYGRSIQLVAPGSLRPAWGISIG
jgi:hypothetical protein